MKKIILFLGIISLILLNGCSNQELENYSTIVSREGVNVIEVAFFKFNGTLRLDNSSCYEFNCSNTQCLKCEVK